MFGVLLAIVTVKGKHQGLVIQLTFDKSSYMACMRVIIGFVIGGLSCWVLFLPLVYCQ